MIFAFLAADHQALLDEISQVDGRRLAALLEVSGSARVRFSGDHDTPDSDLAREQVGVLDAELLRLRSIQTQAVIVEPPTTDDVVAIGTLVILTGPQGDFGIELASHYLAAEEADTDRVSCSSPLGRKLLGRRVGDRLTGVGPNNLSYTIRAIAVINTKELVSA